ncbi:MAG TPA: biotin--[acetyl-CoA-carboxylase] ligase [Gemmatimonadota bacterium]|nr:biotin--[acetyl-CoA-carboxylase] ligase [Gemmatimonadota bacterium]
MTPSKARKWAGLTLDELRDRWGRDDVHLFGSVGSTNDVARELAEEDAPSGTVVLAREQSGGRGRAGRSWYSPEGGVYLSMVFRPGRVENPELLPILAGLGMAAELERRIEGLVPALKWPNDLVAGDRKFGGILSEAAWGEDGIRHLVVGTGINVAPLGSGAPRGLRSRAISIEGVVDHDVPLEEVADAVVAGLEAYVPSAPPRLDAELLKLADRYDWLRDRRVHVTPPDAEEGLPGVCVGIAPDGALLFRPDRGALRRLHGGTVRAEEARS